MAEAKRFIVIGLGSFGAALATRLSKNHCRVTGLDHSKGRVEELKELLYEAVIGDATDRETMEALPLKNADGVLISMGQDISRSMLAALHAKELGARQIIVKGVTPEHGRLLKHLGVERVVYPEIEIAETLADRMTWPNVVDFLPIDPEYSIVEMTVPDSFAGKTLEKLALRRQSGVWVVALKDALTGKLKMFPSAETVLAADQLMLVVGKHEDLDVLKDQK